MFTGVLQPWYRTWRSSCLWKRVDVSDLIAASSSMWRSSYIVYRHSVDYDPNVSVCGVFSAISSICVQAFCGPENRTWQLKLLFVEHGQCEWLYCIWFYHLTLYRHSVALFELTAHFKKSSNSVRIGRQLLIHVTVSRPRMQGFQWFTMCGGSVWMYAMVYKLYSIISFELFLSSLVLVAYLFDEEDLWWFDPY